MRSLCRRTNSCVGSLLNSAVYICNAVYPYFAVVLQMRDRASLKGTRVSFTEEKMLSGFAALSCHSAGPRVVEPSLYLFVAVVFSHRNFPSINLQCTIPTLKTVLYIIKREIEIGLCEESASKKTFVRI